jgi:hypothetical protein
MVVAVQQYAVFLVYVCTFIIYIRIKFYTLNFNDLLIKTKAEAKENFRTADNIVILWSGRMIAL